ncbi:MAG: hypothetical protein M3Z66_03835 [Chloroflexota bacterium]|nr:hypothetical protein [Chloroflexota bacterium]
MPKRRAVRGVPVLASTTGDRPSHLEGEGTGERGPSSDARTLYWMDERLGPQGPTGRRDKVLIVSDRYHPEADRVTLKLHQRGALVCRLYPEELQEAGRLEIHLGDETPSRLVVPLWDLSLDEIRSAWLCEPLETHSPAWNAALNGVLGSLDQVSWVSEPAAMERAGNSLWVLDAAVLAGLPAPRTLLTNNPAAAQAFFDDCRGAVLVRPLRRGEDGGRVEAVHLARLRQAPGLFQEARDEELKVRVAIVGREVFAAERHNVPHEPYVRHIMPNDVSNACLRLLDRCGLGAATIDLHAGPGDAYRFLSLDPYGNWLPLQEQAEFPIADAIADRLIDGWSPGDVGPP